MAKPVGLELLYSPDENSTACADIIFVHGLFGHRQETWTKVLKRNDLPQRTTGSRPRRRRDRIRSLLNAKPSSELHSEESAETQAVGEGSSDESSKIFWPLDLLPRTLPDCRIYTWGYSTDIIGGSTTTVFQHARNLLSNVADVRISSVDRQRPIVWVAHSLGGIVVKDALNQSRTMSTHLKEILPATYGVCYLGTPHRGSSLAPLASTVSQITRIWGCSPSIQIIQDLKYDAETLDRIQRTFKETLDLCKSQGRQIFIRSFCEAYKTYGRLVVDHFSAMIDDVDEIVTDIAANHSQLSKFASSADSGYVDISNALKRWLVELREKSSNHYGLLEELKMDYIRKLENRERGRRVGQVENNHGDTYAWLFSDAVTFEDWLRGAASLERESIFWIHGKPGSGKSTLMKYALLHSRTRKLLQESYQGPWTLIPFFFSDRGSSVQKTVDGLLQELLYQILCHYRELVELVISVSLRSICQESFATVFTFDDRDPGRIIWSRKSVQDARKLINDDAEFGDVERLCSPEAVRKSLDAITRQNEVPMNIAFFIDALDEHQGNHRDLIDTLRRLSSLENSAAVRIKLCLASRRESVFPGAFAKCPGFAIHDYTHSDIKKYVVDRVESSFDVLIVSDEDRKQIEPLTAEIMERAKGVFVWVKLVVDELIQGIDDGNSISQLRRTLSSIPTGLNALYKRILQKRKPEHKLEFYIMAQILLCSLDPMSLQSLMTITDVALPGGAAETMSIFRMRQRLVSRCGGLIEIYEETPNGQNAGKNRQEYSDAQNHALGDAEIGESNSPRETHNEEGNANDHSELALHESEPDVSSDDISSVSFSTSSSAREYITELIDDELYESRDQRKKIYVVRFLHQTVKSFFETPANVMSMFKDPEQCPTENGYRYILNFCVKAMTVMTFDQALIHRAIIKRLFSYARLLEQRMGTDFADLLDILLIEHRRWFPERFDMAVCGREQEWFWDDCFHSIPHSGLRTDGLNLWQICAHGHERSCRDFSLLRCRALPIDPSTRAFDLLFLTAHYGLSYYVKRKVLDGAPMVCPISNRSLLWASVGSCLSSRSISSFYEGLKMVDFLIPRSPSMDMVYDGLTPLALAIDKFFLIDDQLRTIIPLLLMQKLLCGGAHANPLIRGYNALSEMTSNYFNILPEQIDRIVELLLQHGADPRIPGQQGYQPLFYSIARGNVIRTETLLRYGADPSCVGNNANALEPPPIDDEIPGLFQNNSIPIQFRMFQDHAAQMHDMLVRYKNPARIAPLCECKQKN